MDSLEERNLNRLRNAKMMIEFQKTKSSPLFAFVLALFFSFLGAHRFYLGQRHLGRVILSLSFGLITLSSTAFAKYSNPVSWLFGLFLITEIILVPHYTNRLNAGLKAQLEIKHGVLRV